MAAAFSVMRGILICARALRVSVAAVATTALTTDLVVPTHAATSGPKNIIYMIGDGMSYGHIASNSLYETGQSKYLVEGAFGADTAKELEGESVQAFEDFNAAVDAAIAWVDQNSSWEETLLIVTADHETGYLSGADETDTWKPQTGTKGTAPTHEWYSTNHTNQVVPFFFKGAGSEDIQAKVSGTDPVCGEYIDNTTVAKLALDEWWFNTAEDDTDNKPSNDGSSNGSSSAGAGLAGAGVMALIFGIITAAAQALGLVKFDFKALQDLIKQFA